MKTPAIGKTCLGDANRYPSRFNASLLLRLQRASRGWGPYLGRCPWLYTAALTARADYKTDYSAKNGKNKNGKKAKHSMAITTENEKTDLHVSEDGSQPAQDDSLS